MGEPDSCIVPDVIFYLLQKGAHREPMRITTGEIAEGIGVSQQTASRKLIALEREGAVVRAGGTISLTPTSVSRVRAFVSEVLESLKGEATIFTGTVSAGIGKGAYFVSQKEYVSGFKKRLDFSPFAGTLNVKIEGEDIEKRITLREQVPILVPGFSRGKTSFGKIDCYRCMINGLPGAVIFPEMSVHGLQVIEVISPFNLRKKLGLSDGSKLTVEMV
jgi:riboflavin kinase, archaea type